MSTLGERMRRWDIKDTETGSPVKVIQLTHLFIHGEYLAHTLRIQVFQSIDILRSFLIG